MVFDEFHRTAKSPVVREQIIQDMREGRMEDPYIFSISVFKRL